MKRVAVCTDFFNADHAYSLVNVASCQIKQLLRNGYQPRVLVDEYFPQPEDVPYPWNEVELFRLPSIPRSNRVELPEGWRDHLERMTNAMREGLEGIDVALSHDLIYQPAQILYNVSSRVVTKEREGSLRWLHLIHSATTPSMLNDKTEYLDSIRQRFPFSFIIYPNSGDLRRVAQNFRMPPEQVKCVPHATDIVEYFGFHPMTRKLVDATQMLGVDIIIVYPIRLDRGKQAEHICAIAGAIKKLGRSVRFICCDFHSTAQDDKARYREFIKAQATKHGLSQSEMIFTSEFHPDLHVSCPRQMIRDLFSISNIFILPSRSETYSLIGQESAICGNLLVLNDDFPPLKSVYGKSPIWLPFGSNINKRTGMDGNTSTQYHPSYEAWCLDQAEQILVELRNDRVGQLRTFLRKERSLDSVFRKHLEPLFFLLDSLDA